MSDTFWEVYDRETAKAKASEVGGGYLYGVIWFRRGPKRLGYWYPSIRWF